MQLKIFWSIEVLYWVLNHVKLSTFSQMPMDISLFFFWSVRPTDFTTIIKGLVCLMKLLIWEVFDGFLDTLRKEIQNIQNIESMRFELHRDSVEFLVFIKLIVIS